MKIAQIAPLFESVPPRGYGGTERVVSALTNELSWMGHEVTLFATADSIADAELVACRATPIGAGKSDSTEAADHILQFDQVRRRLGDFDILHFHTRFSHFPMFEDVARRTVTTCHNRVGFPELGAFYRRFGAFPLIAISKAQRATRPEANWADVIYHGFPLDHLVAHRTEPDTGYLAFLGRICPEKGVMDAIDIARRAGRQLRIAARVNDFDRDYWTNVVRKEVDGDQIVYVGEIAQADKCRFLNGAAALLFPIKWPEPFGLAMIEAMACGTPVVAYRFASAPEIVEHGRSGFLVRDVDHAADMLNRLADLDRTEVRRAFEERFSASVMAERHVRLYERLTDWRRPLASSGLKLKPQRSPSVAPPVTEALLTSPTPGADTGKKPL